MELFKLLQTRVKFQPADNLLNNNLNSYTIYNDSRVRRAGDSEMIIFW